MATTHTHHMTIEDLNELKTFNKRELTKNKNLNLNLNSVLSLKTNAISVNGKVFKSIKCIDENEIPKINEYNTFINTKYNVVQLKNICRHYSLRVTGTKNELFKRVSTFIKLSYYAVKIQKRFRSHLMKQCNKLRGPARLNRKLCVNETDFFLTDDLTDIPYEQFISFKDRDGYIYGFDVISLYTLLTKDKTTALNPYTRTEMPNGILKTVKHLVSLSKILGISIDIIFKPDEQSPDKIIENKVLAIFQAIDGLGNYSNPQWFNELPHPLIVVFIKELYDIWTYRAQLPIITKLEICPPYGDPFSNAHISYISTLGNEEIKNIAIKIMENLVYSGVNRESQYLGATFVLSALTLVNNNAALALPWLFQSVAHIN